MHGVNLKSLLASLLVHVLVGAMIITGLPLDDAEFSSDQLIIDVLTEAMETPQAAVSLPKKAALSGDQKVKSGRAGARNQIRLFPEVNFSKAFTVSGGGKEKAEANPAAFSDPKSYDSNINEIFGEDSNENWAHFKEVYTKVDSNLNFDSILAQYNHFGRVYVQFGLDKNGLLKTDDLKVTANDSILKVHVLRALKKSFSEPQSILNSAKGDKGLLYQARFEFNFGNYRQNFSKQKEFGRPVFSFRRFTEERPVPEELLEQLLTGGVSPNISSMYERWQKYNQKERRKTVEFDPFISYKNDPFYFM